MEQWSRHWRLGIPHGVLPIHIPRVGSQGCSLHRPVTTVVFHPLTPPLEPGHGLGSDANALLAKSEGRSMGSCEGLHFPCK